MCVCAYSMRLGQVVNASVYWLSCGFQFQYDPATCKDTKLYILTLPPPLPFPYPSVPQNLNSLDKLGATT